MNDIDNLLKILKKNPDIGIIKLEVYRSEKPNIDFLKKVREITKKKKIILIFDECTSGSESLVAYFKNTMSILILLYLKALKWISNNSYSEVDKVIIPSEIHL